VNSLVEQGTECGEGSAKRPKYRSLGIQSAGPVWQKPGWNLVSPVRLPSRSFSILQATTLALLPGCIYSIAIYHLSFLFFIQTQILPKQDRKLSDYT